jgi:hypothetical protein
MSMTGRPFIIIFLGGSGFWFILFTSSITDNYHDICILDQTQYVFGEILAESIINLNSNSVDKNEEKLGKAIGKCYLNPLCFKLEIPQNGTR